MCTGLAVRLNSGGENDMKEDLRIMKINIWTKCIQDRGKWKEVIERTRRLTQ